MWIFVSVKAFDWKLQTQLDLAWAKRTKNVNKNAPNKQDQEPLQSWLLLGGTNVFESFQELAFSKVSFQMETYFDSLDIRFQNPR